MRATTITGLIVAAALGAAGCGGGDDRKSDQPRESSGTGQALEGAGESTTTGGDLGETAPGPESEPDDHAAQGALGSRDGQIDGDAVRLAITELDRSGSTTALTFELTVGEARAGEDEPSAQVAQTFDDGLSDVDGGKGQDSSTVDGVSLVDAANRKRYLVARDSAGVCVCDGELSGTFVKPGAPVVLSATFGAPPADVEAVDVVIPKFGTFKDVPLS